MAFAQENATQYLENQLLLDILENQNTLREKVSKNVALIEDVKTKLNELESQTLQEFVRIEDKSMIEFSVIVTITALSVIGSGYLGWHVHKKEFNSELAKTHFEEIKQNIIPQLQEFTGSLDGWNYIGKEITCAEEKEIKTGRTLDLHILSSRRDKDNNTWFGELDVDLFVDFIENHYPIISKLIQQTYSIGIKYNEKRHNLIQLIQKQLKLEIGENYQLINSDEPLIDDEEHTDGRPKNSIIVDTFAWFLGSSIIAKTSADKILVQRQSDGFALNVTSSQIDGGRVAYPTQNDDSHDEELLKEYSTKILNNEKFIKERDILNSIFNEYKQKVETLRLTLQKILGKQIPKINKKWLIKSSCPYIKDEL